MEPEVRVFISAMLALSILATIVVIAPIIGSIVLPINPCPDYSADVCSAKSECVWNAETSFCDYNQDVMYYETLYKERGLINAALIIIQAIIVVLVAKFMKRNALIKNTLAITAILAFIYAILLGAMLLVPNSALIIGIVLILIFWFVALKVTTPAPTVKETPKKKSKK